MFKTNLRQSNGGATDQDSLKHNFTAFGNYHNTIVLKYEKGHYLKFGLISSDVPPPLFVPAEGFLFAAIVGWTSLRMRMRRANISISVQLDARKQ